MFTLLPPYPHKRRHGGARKNNAPTGHSLGRLSRCPKSGTLIYFFFIKHIYTRAKPGTKSYKWPSATHEFLQSRGKIGVLVARTEVFIPFWRAGQGPRVAVLWKSYETMVIPVKYCNACIALQILFQQTPKPGRAGY